MVGGWAAAVIFIPTVRRMSEYCGKHRTEMDNFESLLRHPLTLNKRRYEAVTGVKFRFQVSWDVTPCKLIDRNKRFGGTDSSMMNGRARLYSKYIILYVV